MELCYGYRVLQIFKIVKSKSNNVLMWEKSYCKNIDL